MDKQKAQHLQREFRTRCCPICLETFDYGDSVSEDGKLDQLSAAQDEEKTVIDDDEEAAAANAEDSLFNRADSASSFRQAFMKSPVDDYGIPRRGADGKKIKMLRCGHIFCTTCWTSWVHSGCGNPCNCPVCRQDVGKSSSRSKRHRQQHLSSSSPPNAGADSEPNEPDVQANYGSLHVDEQANGNTAEEDINSSNDNNNGRVVRIDTLLGGTVSIRYPSLSTQRRASYHGEDLQPAPINESVSLLGNHRISSDDRIEYSLD